MNEKQNMKHWNLYIRDDQMRWLKCEALTRLCPMAQIVREAIDEWINISKQIRSVSPNVRLSQPSSTLKSTLQKSKL